MRTATLHKVLAGLLVFMAGALVWTHGGERRFVIAMTIGSITDSCRPRVAGHGAAGRACR